jgi:tetratricopeptide (TPR) repeat protein
VGDHAKVVEYASRAGDVAVRLYAPTEARLHYEQALDALAHLPENDENRRRRMDTLAKEAIVSRFSDSPPRNLARLEEAKSIATRLLASDPGVRRQLAEIYHWMGFIELIQNQYRKALGYFDDSSAQAQVLGDEQLEAMNLVHAAAVLNFQGRFGEAEPLLHNSINLISKAGIPTEALYMFAQLGLSLANQGFYAEGLARARQALTMAQQANHTGGLEVCHTILVQIYRLGDDIPRMLEASRAVVETAQATRDIVFVCSGSFFVAWAQSYLGNRQAAFESLARARGILQTLNGQIPSRELYAAVEAEIALNAGQVEEAQALAEQAVSLARSVESIFAEGLARRVQGQAIARNDPRNWDLAETHLSESLRLFEQGTARLEAARTHRGWGELLQDCGSREAAREHLEKAAAKLNVLLGQKN